MKIFFKIFLLLSILSSNSVFAADLYNGATVSVQVNDLVSGESIYELNPQLNLIPASSLKLVTAYAALKLLPGDFKFLTQIYYEGEIREEELKGNLYIKFSGDPTLKRDDLFNLLKKLNIKSINGSVYIDESTFDDELYAPGWTSDANKFCYQAPIRAGIIDKFCAQYNLVDEKYIEDLSPSYITLSNHIKSLDEEDCEVELTYTGDNKYKLHGCSIAKNLPLKLNIAILDGNKYIKSIIREGLISNNITHVDINFAEIPNDSKLLATHESIPLPELIKILLKDSDNHIAECLFKTFSYKQYGQGNWKNSQKIVKRLLEQDFGDSAKNVIIKDGSGISRFNLINVSFFNKLLQEIYFNPSIYKSLKDALPIAGVDGTLKNLFCDSCLKNNLQAKTGTLTNISSLTGYIFDINSKSYSFSIIVNGATESPYSIRELQEKILEEILLN